MKQLYVALLSLCLFSNIGLAQIAPSIPTTKKIITKTSSNGGGSWDFELNSEEAVVQNLLHETIIAAMSSGTCKASLLIPTLEVIKAKQFAPERLAFIIEQMTLSVAQSVCLNLAFSILNSYQETDTSK